MRMITMTKRNPLMDHEVEHEKSLPEYVRWFLKSKGLTVVEAKKSQIQIVPIKDTQEVLKHREVEQTQELLVCLIQELFNKIDQMESSQDFKRERFENTSESQTEDVIPKKEAKIEFADLSWYRKKLERN